MSRGSVFLAFSFATSIASAQIPPVASPAAPPNGFTFDGKWACSGQFGNGKQHRSSYEGSSVLGGAWVQLKEVDIEPAGYQGLYLIGYDKAKNQVIEFDANNFGGAVYTGTGWQAGTLTLTSADPDPKALKNRFVFHIADAAHFSVSWEVNQAGEWKAADHLDCSHEVHS